MGSEAFRNMKKAVLRAVRSIDAGRVTTAADLGAALNVPARHVAYILSDLAPEEAELVPTHRVVPKDGRFPTSAKRTDKHRRAMHRLAGEGVSLDGAGRVEGLDDRIVIWPDTYRQTIWADEPDEDD